MKKRTFNLVQKCVTKEDSTKKEMEYNRNKAKNGVLLRGLIPFRPKLRNVTTGVQGTHSVNWVANLTLPTRASKVDFIESLILLWKMWD